MPNFEELWDSRLDVELNSASTVLFTKARRKQAINDGALEFSDLTECLIRQSSVTCSCSVTEYALLSSTDYTRPSTQNVEYIRTDSNGVVSILAGKDDFPQRPVTWRNDQDPGWRESTVTVTHPTGYYLRPDGGNLYIGLAEPPKIGSSEAAELRVPYVARPAPMASTGEIPFTVSSVTRSDLTVYHQALVHFAAYRLLPLQGKLQEAHAALQVFLSYVTRYRQAERPKGGQVVTFARNYMREAQNRSGDASGRTVPGWSWQSGG